jgi:hypothetical protein
MGAGAAVASVAAGSWLVGWTASAGFSTFFGVVTGSGAFAGVEGAGGSGREWAS